MALSSFFSFNKNSQEANNGEGSNEENKQPIGSQPSVGDMNQSISSLNSRSGFNSKFPVSVISPPSTTAITTSNAYGQTSINGTFSTPAASNFDTTMTSPTTMMTSNNNFGNNVNPDFYLSSQLHHAQQNYQQLNQDMFYGDQHNNQQQFGFAQKTQAVAQPAPIVPTTAIKVDTEEPDIPRGVLKVTIIRAQGLNVTPTSKPYVVCTYEAAEAITTAPKENEKSNNLMVDNSQSNFFGTQPQAIRRNIQRPVYTRQSSNQFMHTSSTTIDASNPKWQHQASFDVIGASSELEICVYDGAIDAFLGKVILRPDTLSNRSHSGWYNLASNNEYDQARGKIQIEYNFNPVKKRHYGPDDFDIIKMLGKGTFGEVFQVRKKDNKRIYAMKVLDKKYIARKKEIAHTFGERNILIAAKSPFIVPLKFTFQTPRDLYFIFDYMAGGELFFHLQNERKFGEERTKFYIAELVCALEHLHDQGVIYRDLKPENILLDANGHIALCDFGLSKLNLTSEDTAKTFCGTTEYLAPEVLLDENGYNKMVDFWSLGVLIFEMCCGWSPFYADSVQQMYKNIAYGKVRFPKEALSQAGRSFVKGLLNRNPNHRLGSKGDAKELKAHSFFADIDWDLLVQKKIAPPFRPHVSSELDTSNFDPEFTQNAGSALGNKQRVVSTPLSSSLQANFNGFTYVDPSMMDTENNYVGTYKKSVYKGPGSLIPGNPNLPPDENVIEDDEEFNDIMDVDEPNIRSPDVDDYDVELV